MKGFAAATPFSRCLVLVSEVEMMLKGVMVERIGRMKATSSPGREHREES